MKGSIIPFEYVSILISLILGLGITQLLSSFSDLLYHYSKVKFYWPQSIWIIFILFLHIQYWFIIYQLNDKPIWKILELIFLILYPISLFLAAKLLLPTNSNEESIHMKIYYKSQFPVLFVVVGISAALSLVFNLVVLGLPPDKQLIILVFSLSLFYVAYRKIDADWVHKIIAILIGISAIGSVILEQDKWIIN